MRISHALLLVALVAGGCVYPHRGTSLTTVHSDRTSTGTIHAPPNIWQLTVVGAHVLPRNRGDLSWDDDGGLPDVYVRIYRDEQLVYESPTLDDTLEPEWNATLPRNFRATGALRFEVWDDDTVGADPVGIFRHGGLPETAMPGVDARILLEGGSYLTIRADNPRPHRGVGIDEYEVRPDELVVVRVMPNSPASRAELVAGDRIVAIGDQRISALSDAQAASALSMAQTRRRALTVIGANGRERQVELDQGFVWLTM